MSKIIKDPIYGYIEIEDCYASIVDSPFFQRLRDIIQTSYVSVYPASLHNRFTHSLGVFYLGKKASDYVLEDFKNVYKEFYESNIEEIEVIHNTFILACLLHDVGHSPFSHTGEKFFFEKVKDGTYLIWLLLLDIVADEKFSRDANTLTGAPHEIMSAYISLKYLIGTRQEEPRLKIDKSLFARSIIGLKYADSDEISSLKNCFIDLLNSQTIDTDRLDYLIRDSYMSGYNSANIDYERLLSAISIKNKNGQYKIIFNKKALSVLENAILAHDEEKKWIQSHPTILYESYLIEGMIRFAVNEFKKGGVELFSAEALTKDGIKKGKENIRLLSDSDIISFAKRFGFKYKFVQSNFDRSKRLKPLWKSEAEYKAIIESKFSSVKGGNLLSMEEYFAKKINPFLLTQDDEFVPVINDKTLRYFNAQLKKAREGENNFYIENRLKALEQIVFLIKKLKALSKLFDVPFEYAFISNGQFMSGFNKENFKNIKIDFPNLERTYEIQDVVNVLGSEERRDQFFYFYVPKELKDKKIKDVISEVINIFLSFSQEFLENK